MNFSSKHQLNQLPIGTRIQFITHRDMDCGEYHREKGTTVILTKVKNITGKKAMWVDTLMKWPVKWIPNQFHVVE